MNIYTEIKNKVNKNREDYKHYVMQLSPSEIYNKAYQINFVESFADMLSSDWIDGLDFLKEPLEYFNKFDDVLGYLYAEWISSDEYYTESWDEMAEWLYNLYKYTVE